MRSSLTPKLNQWAKLCALIVTAMLFTGSASIRAQDGQHDGHNMPGMEMGKPKPKPKPKPTTQKKKQQPAPKKDDMEGMDMSKPMPSPSPSSSPSPTPTPSPQASPTPHTHMPGMQMPDASQSPTPAPSATPSPEKMEMNMPMPEASPTPTATPDNSNGMGNMDMSGQGNKGQPAEQKNSMPEMMMPGTKGTGRMSATDPNALMIMSGGNMDIRVGASAHNSIPMGQMGSGTAWQPATTPMYMQYKRAGDWLIFFHGDMKLGVNSQGGPRGLTKFESQNWFMPMAFRRVGRGTLQLRGMFSLEPWTFRDPGSPQLFQTGEVFRGEPIRDAQH